jgi:hypothetical protein
MTQPNQPPAPTDNEQGAFNGTLDPNQIPQPVPEASTPNPYEGYVMPQKGTPEFKAEQARVKYALRDNISTLAEAAQKPYHELTPQDLANFEYMRGTMDEVTVGGRKMYSNNVYDQHPIAEGKRHTILATPEAEAVFNKADEVARHRENERELARQAQEAAVKKAAQEAIAAQQQADAEQARREADAARQQQEDLLKQQRAAQANQAAIDNMTPAEKANKSQNAVDKLLQKVHAGQFDPKDIRLGKNALLGELRPEELYRLELELTDWVNNERAKPEQATAPGETTHEHRITAVNELRNFTQQNLKTAALDYERAQEAINTRENYDDDHRHVGRFERVKNEYDAEKLQRQEQLDADAAWDAAHPRQESPGMIAAQDYLHRTYRLQRFGAEKGKRATAKEQAALLEDIYDDRRALGALMDSGLLRNKKVRARAQELIESIDQPIQAYNQTITRRGRGVWRDITRATATEQKVGGIKPGELGTYNDVVSRLHNNEVRAVYQRLQANRVRADVPGFNYAQPPELPMTEARQRVIDYFENEAAQGDQIQGFSGKAGERTDRIVRRAQVDQLARSIKGDGPAETELRNRGHKVPRLVTNREKNDARVDRINNTVQGAADFTVRTVRRATNRVRRVANAVRPPTRSR